MVYLTTHWKKKNAEPGVIVPKGSLNRCFLGAHCVNQITPVLEHEHRTILKLYQSLVDITLLLKVALPQSPAAPTRYTFLKSSMLCGHWGCEAHFSPLVQFFVLLLQFPVHFIRMSDDQSRMSVFNSFQWFHVHHTPFLPFQIWFQFQEISQETLGQKIHCYPINTYTKSHSTPMIPMKSSCGSGWIMHTDYRWL